MSSAFADQLTMLRSINVVANPYTPTASHNRLGDEAVDPYKSDRGDIVSAEDFRNTPAKSRFAVDYPTPPSVQRSMIPRKKTSNIRLRETSDSHTLTHERSHVAFMQKSERVREDMTTQDQSLPTPTSSRKNGFKDQTPESRDTFPISPTANAGVSTESKWIHRDNLAMIEKQELQELDSKLHKMEDNSGAYSASRIQTGFAQRGDEGCYDGLVTPISKRLRVDSPVNGTLEAVEARTSPTSGGSQDPSIPLTTPNTRQNSRNVSSRIPISLSTPSPARPTTAQGRKGNIRLVPNPSGSIQYSKPRQARTGDDLSPTALKTRPASASYTRSPLSGSVSGSTFAEGPQEAAPLKVRPLSRDATSFHNRRRSMNQNVLNAQKVDRTPSGRKPRPMSSSGRPHTPLNRPEGEAPWIADMYKPDPMLPQEEQIVPTHAKRLGLHIKNSPKRESALDQDLGSPAHSGPPEVTTEKNNTALSENGGFQTGRNEHVEMKRERETSPNLRTSNPQAPDLEVPKSSSSEEEDSSHIASNIPTTGNPETETSIPLTQQQEQRQQPSPHPTTTTYHDTPPTPPTPSTGTVGLTSLSRPTRQTQYSSEHKPHAHGNYKIMPMVRRTPSEMQHKYQPQQGEELALPIHPALRGPSPQQQQQQIPVNLSRSHSAQSRSHSRPHSRSQSLTGRYPHIGPPQLPRKESLVAGGPPPSRVRAGEAAALQKQGGMGRVVRTMDLEEAPRASGKEKKGCAGCCVVM